MIIESFENDEENGKYITLRIIDIYFHTELEERQLNHQKKKQTSIKF